MSELSRETKELLARGRGGASMPTARRDDVKRKVLASVAAGSIVTTSATAAAWSMAAKVVGVAAFAAVVTGGAVVAVRHARAPSADPTHASIAQGPTREGAGRAAGADLSLPTPGTPSTSVAGAVESPAVAAPEAVAASPVPPAPLSSPVGAPPVESARAPSSLAASPTPSTPAAHGNPASNGAAAAPTSPAAPRAGSAVVGAVDAPEPPTGGAPASPVAAPPANAATPPSTTASLADEARLVRAAQQALTDGDPATALRLADEHAARFPHGALEPEAEAIRVFALCAHGEAPRARDAARAFLAAHPSGPLATRVRTSCGGQGVE